MSDSVDDKITQIALHSSGCHDIQLEVPHLQDEQRKLHPSTPWKAGEKLIVAEKPG
jgi:hypothetical protein